LFSRRSKQPDLTHAQISVDEFDIRGGSCGDISAPG
jgi:hypothetical protein